MHWSYYSLALSHGYADLPVGSISPLKPFRTSEKVLGVVEVLRVVPLQWPVSSWWGSLGKPVMMQWLGIFQTGSRFTGSRQTVQGPQVHSSQAPNRLYRDHQSTAHSQQRQETSYWGHWIGHKPQHTVEGPIKAATTWVRLSQSVSAVMTWVTLSQWLLHDFCDTVYITEWCHNLSNTFSISDCCHDLSNTVSISDYCLELTNTVSISGCSHDLSNTVSIQEYCLDMINTVSISDCCHDLSNTVSISDCRHDLSNTVSISDSCHDLTNFSARGCGS